MNLFCGRTCTSDSDSHGPARLSDAGHGHVDFPCSATIGPIGDHSARVIGGRLFYVYDVNAEGKQFTMRFSDFAYIHDTCGAPPTFKRVGTFWKSRLVFSREGLAKERRPLLEEFLNAWLKYCNSEHGGKDRCRKFRDVFRKSWPDVGRGDGGGDAPPAPATPPALAATHATATTAVPGAPTPPMARRDDLSGLEKEWATLSKSYTEQIVTEVLEKEWELKEDVKREFIDLGNSILRGIIYRVRRRERLQFDNIQLLGNPGCGKTTSAKQICLLYNLLVWYREIVERALSQDEQISATSDDVVRRVRSRLEENKVENEIDYEKLDMPFIEKEKSAFEGKHVGDATANTKDIFDEVKAKNGMLFLDEAYSLGTTSYGGQVVDAFCKQIQAEAGRSKLPVVLAGYTKEMGELMEMNPGMPSRFQKRIKIADTTPDELVGLIRHYARRACGGDFWMKELSDRQVHAAVVRAFHRNAKHPWDKHNARLAQIFTQKMMDLLDEYEPVTPLKLEKVVDAFLPSQPDTSSTPDKIIVVAVATVKATSLLGMQMREDSQTNLLTHVYEGCKDNAQIRGQLEKHLGVGDRQRAFLRLGGAWEVSRIETPKSGGDAWEVSRIRTFEELQTALSKAKDVCDPSQPLFKVEMSWKEDRRLSSAGRSGRVASVF